MDKEERKSMLDTRAAGADPDAHTDLTSRLVNSQALRRKIDKAARDWANLEAKIAELRTEKREITKGVVALGVNKKGWKLALAFRAMEDEERELVDTSLLICGAAMQLNMFGYGEDDEAGK
jgi:hypothetical protein